MEQSKLRSRVPPGLTALLVAAMALAVSAATTLEAWRVESIETRGSGGARPARMALAIRAPADERVRHVLIVPSFEIHPRLTTAGTGDPDPVNPWVQSAGLLNERGIAVVLADAPSDVDGTTPAARSPRELRQDLQAAVVHLHKRYPGAAVHLGLFAAAAAPVLDVAAGVEGLNRIVVASGDFLDARTSDWSALQAPVLLVHAPTTTCEHAPFLESQLVAASNRFALTSAGYAAQAQTLDCGRGSHHALSDLEAPFAQAVAAWLDGAPAPRSIGFAAAQVAWREQIVAYSVPGALGATRLEMTLLHPVGPGPFAAVVFNHGDFNIDSPHMRHKRRYRELVVAAEFLRIGFAVALPARRGVAMSAGSYPARFYINDADPTYKARVHAQDIVPAIEHLKALPAIDAQRIVLAGHSAGGFSVAYIASTNPAGVIGAVNFSGGRTDASQDAPASAWNRMMISGFDRIGRTSRVPTLFIFAANDSLYTADTIRAAYAAFNAAGGRGKLLLSPPVAGDGHWLLNQPEHWREALGAFMVEITEQGAPSARNPALPPAQVER